MRIGEVFTTSTPRVNCMILWSDMQGSDEIINCEVSQPQARNFELRQGLPLYCWWRTRVHTLLLYTWITTYNEWRYSPLVFQFELPHSRPRIRASLFLLQYSTRLFTTMEGIEDVSPGKYAVARAIQTFFGIFLFFLSLILAATTPEYLIFLNTSSCWTWTTTWL